DADDRHQGQYEQNDAPDRHHDQVHRVERGLVVIGLAADAQHPPQHRLQCVEEGGLLHHDLHQLFPPRPATSKKVYDTAMVFTSFGSFGSTTNTTGMRRTSPAASVWWVKQKHSSLRKYS